MSVDMHCHLDLYPDPFSLAEECNDRGTYILSVTTTPRAWQGTSKLAEGKRRIQTGLGLHPHLAHQRSAELKLFDDLLMEVKYVGEIGLDGGREFKEYREIQLKVFRHILKSVRRIGGRIMSIHSKLSAAVVLDELEGIPGTPILHWFSGSQKQLQRAIGMGCWFSVGPAMLNAKNGHDVALMMPRDRILTETDGPFAKYAGIPLQPWDCEIAVSQLADIWSVSAEEASMTINKNFKSLLTNQ